MDLIFGKGYTKTLQDQFGIEVILQSNLEYCEISTNELNI